MAGQGQLKTSTSDEGGPFWTAINAYQDHLDKFHIVQHKKTEITVGSLGDDGLATMPINDDETIYRVPFLDIAGLVTLDSDLRVDKTALLFYRRDAVTDLWKLIDDTRASAAGKAVLFVKGPPGTGKSTAIWRKTLSIAASDQRGKCNILWLKLDRTGEIDKVVYFQGKNFCTTDFLLKVNHVENFLITSLNDPDTTPVDLVVVDGMTSTNGPLFHVVRKWVEENKTKRAAVFSSSLKVEELRSHENATVIYHTIHSWQVQEFAAALVQNDSPTQLFRQCSDLFYKEYLGMESYPFPFISDDNPVSLNAAELAAMEASLLAAEPVDETKEKTGAAYSATTKDDVTGGEEHETDGEDHPAKRPKTITTEAIGAILEQRYEYSGGSARWMFNYSRTRIDDKLDEYCQNTANREAILRGYIGPTSQSSTNYFFGSSKKRNGRAEYFLVSKRAVEILGKSCQGSSYKVLYDFADRLENPAFVGWVVESDFFFQVNKAQQAGTSISLQPISSGAPGNLRPVGMQVWQHAKNARLRLTEEASKKAKAKEQAQKKIKAIASGFVPTGMNTSIVGKPSAWNQGGYDAFFVERAGTSADKNDKRIRICLRFVQVTKGIEHDLKAHYISSVVLFFEKAGYEVVSVEVAFILTHHNRNSFQLKSVIGENALTGYKKFGLQADWNIIDATSITRYELNLSHARAFY